MATNTATAMGYTGKYSSDAFKPYTKFATAPVFSAPEAQSIITAIENNAPHTNSYDDVKRYGIQEKLDSNNYMLYSLPKREKSCDWIYQRIATVIKNTNKIWQFNVKDFEELKMFKFQPKTLVSNWIQSGVDKDTLLHKYRFEILLSDQEDLQGGEMQLRYAGETLKLPPLKAGEMVIFPAFLESRWERIIKGTRYSLVSWVNGHDYWK